MNAPRPLLLATAALLVSACQAPARPPPQAPTSDGGPPAAPAPYVPDLRFTQPDAPPAEASAVPEAEHLFRKHGCGACHGVGAPFHDKLVAARGKPAEQVAQWILNPRAFKPTTLMPTYANQLTQAQAQALAGWVLAGNPGGKEQRSAQ